MPIALHLVNAGFATGDLSFTYQMTGVFTQLFEVLEQAYGQAVLELRLGEPLTEDEVTYLTLHVARMVDDLRVH